MSNDNDSLFQTARGYFELPQPPTRFTKLRDDYILVPLIGYKYVLAVRTKQEWLGFVCTFDLGHNNVSDWKLATNWKDQGY